LRLSNSVGPIQLKQIEAYATERCARHDAAHDVLHLRRVLANARLILDDELRAGVDVRPDIVHAACWLHDIVQLPKGSEPAGESARRSASEARSLLEQMAVTVEDMNQITHAIEAHSFSGGMRPATIEAAIVQDADRLDALGAVGIARLWVTAAELGSALYHATDPVGVDRSLDDRAYGLDHIERKLLTLPDTMTTRSGRLEAKRRAGYVANYRAMFLSEMGGNWPAVRTIER
jgi:uncharacterized protein